MTHVADDPAVCIPGSVGGRVHRRRSATVSNASESVGGARDAPWARAAVLARARHGPLRNGPNCCLLYTSPSPRDGLLSIRRQRQMCIRDRSNASESVGGARDAPWARAAVLARARHGPLRNGPNCCLLYTSPSPRDGLLS